MMILMYFILLTIFLVVGFGASYWLFIEANKQEGGLKIFGKILGWLLIIMTLLVALLNFYYSVKMVKSGYIKEEIQESLQEDLQEQKTAPMIKKEDAKEEIQEQKEELQEQKSTPIKNENEAAE